MYFRLYDYVLTVNHSLKWEIMFSSDLKVCSDCNSAEKTHNPVHYYLKKDFHTCHLYLYINKSICKTQLMGQK